VPGAKDFSLSNENLNYGNLATIRDQARASSGAWEYQLEIRTLAMPWIKRGSMLKLTGLERVNAAAIDLPAMLVYEVQHAFSNDGSIAIVKCVCWSSTEGAFPLS